MPANTAKFFLIFSLLLSPTLAGSDAIYFRSNGGLAGRDAGPLPESFDSNELLRWRVPLETGQSSPILSGGRIFLTTCNPESKTLATVALDRETGKTVWTRPVPVA